MGKRSTVPVLSRSRLGSIAVVYAMILVTGGFFVVSDWLPAGIVWSGWSTAYIFLFCVSLIGLTTMAFTGDAKRLLDSLLCGGVSIPLLSGVIGFVLGSAVAMKYDLFVQAAPPSYPFPMRGVLFVATVTIDGCLFGLLVLLARAKQRPIEGQ